MTVDNQTVVVTETVHVSSALTTVDRNADVGDQLYDDVDEDDLELPGDDELDVEDDHLADEDVVGSNLMIKDQITNSTGDGGMDLDIDSGHNNDDEDEDMTKNLYFSDDVDAFCEPYRGKICSDLIGTRMIYVTGEGQQDTTEQKLTESNALKYFLQTNSHVSPECSQSVLFLVCVYAFPLCDQPPQPQQQSTSKLSGHYQPTGMGSLAAIRPRQFCRTDCMYVQDVACKTMFRDPETNPLTKLMLPTCAELPPSSSHADCVSLSHLLNVDPRTEHVCYNQTGKLYRGLVSTTMTGRPCLPWMSVTSKKEFNHLSYVSHPELGNHQYCRNPGHDTNFDTPWCFVNDVEGVAQESCYVPKCGGLMTSELWMIVVPSILIPTGLAFLLIITYLLCCKRGGSNKGSAYSKPKQSSSNLSDGKYYPTSTVGSFLSNNKKRPSGGGGSASGVISASGTGAGGHLFQSGSSGIPSNGHLNHRRFDPAFDDHRCSSSTGGGGGGGGGGEGTMRHCTSSPKTCRSIGGSGMLMLTRKDMARSHSGMQLATSPLLEDMSFACAGSHDSYPLRGHGAATTRCSGGGASSQTANSDSRQSTVKEVQYSQIHFFREIGDGKFGPCYIGELLDASRSVSSGQVGMRPYRRKCFVKTLKDPSCMDQFLSDCHALTSKPPYHPNLSCLIGLCHDPHAALMEYLPLNLHELLVDGRKQRNGQLVLSPMLVQTANALQYLSSRQLVHRDVASRNVLVDESHSTAKLCDFAVCRTPYASDYYRLGGSMLPVRWMAPESIITGSYSQQSDVWSFGVLLWEFCTGGKRPYDGATNPEVVEKLRDRQLLSLPTEYHPAVLRALMLECWLCNPHHRPTFTDIVSKLRTWVDGQLCERSAMKDGRIPSPSISDHYQFKV